MVTLASFCLSHGIDMHEAGDTELARVWTKVDAIRAKQASKPTGSALPSAISGAQPVMLWWLPISQADITITDVRTFSAIGVTIRNSDTYWVRDDDGRVYEACWTDHRSGYWWDLAAESPVNPVEFMPHPFEKRFSQPEGGTV